MSKILQKQFQEYFKPYFTTIFKFSLLIIFVKIISKAIFLHHFNN